MAEAASGTRFSDLTRSTEAGTARLLVRAPSQQQQQNLKSLEGQCFLQGFARVSFTKSEAFERHIRMASEQGLWVSLLRPEAHSTKTVLNDLRFEDCIFAVTEPLNSSCAEHLPIYSI